MDIRYLYEFSVLAKVLNYTEAADMLYISQPTLTRHINAIEDELCRSLFNRTSHGISLTPYGQILLRYAKNIEKTYAECVSRIQIEAKRQEKENNINIITISDMSYYGVDRILEEYRQLFPENHINVMNDHFMGSREKIVNGEGSFGFIRSNKQLSDDEHMENILYATDHLVAIVHRGHPLAKYDSITINELKERAILTLPLDTQLGEIIRAACMSVGFTPNVITDDFSIGNIVEYAKLGMGIGVLTNRHIGEAKIHDGVAKIIKIEPFVKSYIYFCYSKLGPMTDGEKEFVKLVKKRSINLGENKI